MNDPFVEIANKTHFNIYNSPMWNSTGRRFAEEIVKHCSAMCGSQADKKNLLKAFGLPVESDVKYPSPPPHWSIESQYERPINIPKGETNENSN